MGNFFGSKSIKVQNKPKDVFEREKQAAEKRLELATKNADPSKKRMGKLVPAIVEMAETPSAPEPDESMNIPSAPLAPVVSYDDAALAEMRYQLNNDADAFLLNNILLSVQFFENYEREISQINDKVISEGKYHINAAMIRYNKHVFFADRIMECVKEHVNYQRSRNQLEAIAAPRMYVIYDNVEAREPGDTSHYSAALDAPFYKLQIEECQEAGYLKLKKQEILESHLKNSNEASISDLGFYEATKDKSSSANDKVHAKESLLLASNLIMENSKLTENIKNNNIDSIPSVCNSMKVVKDSENLDKLDQDEELIPKKSILKKAMELNTTIYIKAKDHHLSIQNNNSSSDSEYGSSGYGSILSGCSTVTESAVPKRIELHTRYTSSSGVLPEECWTEVVKKAENESDDEDENTTNSQSKFTNSGTDDSDDEDDDKIIDSAYATSRKSCPKVLHVRSYYLNSMKFMNNFIANFKQDLGNGLFFSQETIRNAMTLGASIYCDSFEKSIKIGYEIIPGLAAKWPNAASEWIIRQRKIKQNPSNNYKYKWPLKYMVDKARDIGCVLIPLVFRPKLGLNPEQKLQWRISFPMAEHYLESFLAHSHFRCYLFALVLHKTFMENEMMIGIDASHIKNHLFWQCEDNFAKYPEDRLGESLRMFLSSFYNHFKKSKLQNYFMDRCNDFENISPSVLLVFQRKLKDILEAPVMHMLYAIDKLKYNSIGFYPTFDCQKLYNILTCKNPLYLSNSNFSATVSDYDKNAKKHRKKIKTNIILPKRLGTERRHLVLKLFIPHFVAMARSSEKFEAINQALIYLEQAQRLCIILLDEPGGDAIAEEYIKIIRDKLADCQRKKIRKVSQQQGVKLPPRNENTERTTHESIYHHLDTDNIANQHSVTQKHGILPTNVTDIHTEKQQRKEYVTDENKTPTIAVAEIHVEQQQKSNKADVEKPKETLKTIRNLHHEGLVLLENREISSISKVDINLQAQELKPSIKENNRISPITDADVQVKEQEKDILRDDNGILTNSFAANKVNNNDQQVHLTDCIIEESYL